MPINQYAALFSLLGTNFGGNGTSTFGLPNLQGAGPMDYGAGAGFTQRTLGETGGSSSVTLLQTEMAVHNHSPMSDKVSGTVATPSGGVWAQAPSAGKGKLKYHSNTFTNLTPMASQALGAAGGSLPHNNLAPYLAMTFIISLAGVFPARG